MGEAGLQFKHTLSKFEGADHSWSGRGEKHAVGRA